MSETDITRNETPPPAVEVWIDAICDRFEATWRQGGKPTIEDYLSDSPEPGHPTLLRELILLDIDYRRRHGETPTMQEYQQRFPTIPLDWLAQELIKAPPAQAGRYRLEEEIARGGMGVVYRAYDPDCHRSLAVKVLQERHCGRHDLESRFLEEAQLTAQLQHPGVPPVHEIGRLTEGRPFFAMKLVKGRTLADLLKERQSPSDDLPRFVGIFGQVCHAVAFAHSRGVLHRDLKPANIMVGAFGEVQVMDWGLAKVIRPESGGLKPPGDKDASTIATVRTLNPGQSSQAGAVMGTVAYMAPEQARGEVDRLDARCDVFGLGAILCEILTDQPPYRGATRDEQYGQALHGELADAFTLLDGCGADAELVWLAKECLAADREARPQDAEVMASAVTAYQAGVEKRLRRAELRRAAAEVRIAEERKRRRLTVALAAATLSLLCLVGGGVWWYYVKHLTRWLGSEGDVLAALREATELDKQGWKQTDYPERWQVTLQSAWSAWKRADGLLNSMEPTADLREQVRAARVELEQAGACQQLAAALDRIFLEYAETEAGRWANRRMAVQYARAFKEHGLDILGTDAGTAVGRVRAHPLREHLLAALEVWMTYAPAAAEKEHLQEVLLAAEAGPSTFRQRWREAQIRKDRAEMVRLTNEAEARDLPAMVYVHMAQALRAVGAGEAAIPLLHQGLARYRGNFWLYYSLGGVYGDMKPPRLEEAIRYFSIASALRDRSAPAHFNLGRTRQVQGDVAGAIRCYRDALAADPKYAMAHVKLGATLQAQGDVAGAIRCYRDALAADPKLAQAHAPLGMALHSQGDVAGAIRCYRDALAADPKLAEVHLALGAALYSRGDMAGTIRCIRDALAADPKLAQTHAALGEALHAQGDVAGAIRCYRDALAADPKDAKAHGALGQALLQQGQLAEARESTQRALELFPSGDPSRRVAILQLRRCERLLALDVRLAAFAKGDAAPADAAERLYLVELCYYKQLYAASARLVSDAFAADSKFADDLQAGHRYRAASAAARAGCGQGKDEPPPDEQARTLLRQQALAWLRADLALWAKQWESDKPDIRAAALKALQCWQADPALACLRDEAALAKLSDAERPAWQQLWAEVDRLLAQAKQALPK
jgi:serine/threonine-protein kinase